MNYPQMNEITVKRTMVNAFVGYDHNLVTSDKAFYDMQNLSGDVYPAIVTRNKRGVVKQLSNAKGIISKDALCYIDGSKVYYNHLEVNGITLNSEMPKQMVSMGAYVVIFPDAVYFNTKKLTDYGNLGHKIDMQNVTVSATNSRQDGTEYENLAVGETAPVTPSVGDYWIDTSQAPSVLKLFTYEEIWSDVPTSYVTIRATGIDDGFSKGDSVTITASSDFGGLLPMDNNGAYTNTFVIQALHENSITVMGNMTSAQINTQADIRLERIIPKMDYVIEAQNRLWGCYYGIGDDGEVVNEIYASALGDPKNWRVYQGTAADSYAVSLGTDGVFTGAVAYQNKPIFFKENYIHAIYGDYPSNYTLNTTTANGIQYGSWRSAAIVSGVLYYKSPTAVCAYDGSLPQIVSSPLGDIPYYNGVAGANGSKLYISLENKDGVAHLFTYDTAKGIWCKEDNVRPLQFAGDSNELYFIDTQNRIMAVNGREGTIEKKLDWSLTTNMQGFEDSDGKRLRKLKLNMLMDEASEATLEAMYDSNGEWREIATIEGAGTTKCTSVIFIPQLCDHFQLRLRGSGYMHLVSITKSVAYGGEVR